MLVANLLLALAWAALRAELTLTNIVVGYALGYLILLTLVRGGVLAEDKYIGKVSFAAGLLLYFLAELLHANIRLTRDVLVPGYSMRPGIIAVPLDATRDGEILLLSALINLTPGSVALDVSPDRSFLYVHVMYMEDPDAARAEIKQGFERRVLQLLR